MLNINKKNLLKNFTQSPKTSILFILLVLGFGEWLISDIVDFSGGSLGFFILCGGSYFYFRNNKPKFNEPNDLKGWVDLCRNDLKFFDEQDEENTFFGNKFLRREELNIILNNDEKQKIAIIKGNNQIEYISLFNKYLRKNQYDLNLINELPSVNCSEVFCSELNKNEAIFYHLNLPLTAKGLIWLKKFPNDMPIWLILNKNNSSDLEHKIEELKSELPEELIKKIIKFDSKNMEFIQKPISFRKFIFNPKRNLENTKKRLLKALHCKWQAEIESYRRIKLKEIQRKNQILIAAAVFASPIPSIDVLSMTIFNSLMIKEIKAIWNCNWSPEILEKVSKEIIKTAIAQGVIEWSGQALLNISKFHGPNYILTGSFQAISAAYLSRVVSRSLADFMAIEKGVTKPDLEFIKNNSEKIVENAFESEKINWKSLIFDMQTAPKLNPS